MKNDAEENVERNKARFLACGKEQPLEKDYALTFTAVMDGRRARSFWRFCRYELCQPDMATCLTHTSSLDGA